MEISSTRFFSNNIDICNNFIVDTIKTNPQYDEQIFQLNITFIIIINIMIWHNYIK